MVATNPARFSIAAGAGSEGFSGSKFPLELDPLEVARSALCLASYQAQDESQEVHIGRLLGHFDRVGLAASDGLRTLWFLRETESLEGGYWIPAPTRVVRLTDSLCLIVGIHPTDELRRHFPSVRRAGAGRVVASRDVADLPAQSLASWQGEDGSTAPAWAQQTIGAAAGHLVPSILDGEIEVFAVRPRSARGAPEAVWTKAGEGGCEFRGTQLLRIRTAPTKHRYFLGRSRNKGEFLEGPVVSDVSRLQFGLAALTGQPLRPTLTASNGTAMVNLPISAPTALRRLLVALCVEEQRSFGRRWVCKVEECQPLLRAALDDLSGGEMHHG
jgi:hypothetical protein